MEQRAAKDKEGERERLSSERGVAMFKVLFKSDGGFVYSFNHYSFGNVSQNRIAEPNYTKVLIKSNIIPYNVM